jgi:long-chain acyl-CoA synthetase
MLEEAAARHGRNPALHQPVGRGKHRVYSWIEYKRAVEEIAAGLRRLGFRKGDVLALDSETRAEFYFADLGVMCSGSIAAALYSSYPAEDRVRTLRACEAKAVFAEGPKTLEALRRAAGQPIGVRWFLLTGEAPDATGLEELREIGRRAMKDDPGLWESIRKEVEPSDPAILYLTSGATGEPKMALVSHRALVANIDMGPLVIPLGPRDATIAWLPSAHIAQRVVIELLPVRCGMPVWFVESLSQLPQALKSVRPTVFLAPPRLWERIYATACTEINRRPAFLRKLFYGALGLGLQTVHRRQEGKPAGPWARATLRLADRLLFRKLRARFGGRLKIPASGAAPLGKDLALFYEVIGMPLVEGYGLTEGGVVTLNPIDHQRAGSIGKPLPGVEVRLAEDGELLVRTPAMFSGYYRDPLATAAVLRDGWLYTGDIAEMDADGFVYITGRKKELLISSNGKKICPARIESLFEMEPAVNHVLLIGDRLPYVSALITVNPAAVPDPEEAKAEVRRAVARVNRRLAPFEQIRKFRILERDFSIEHGELTATMKLRRSRVLENHRALIAEMYAGKEEARQITRSD